MAASQQLPLYISIAPFPEGFQGDMDETFQQAVQLMETFVEGNFITGIILPPGSTLPSTDQGAILMGGVWYFWNPVTGAYEPQSYTAKISKNYVKNCVYQVQQTGSAFTIGAGVTPVYDLSEARATLGNVLAVSPDTGPLAGPLNDLIPSAIKYTVGPTLVPSLAVGDLYTHEHLIEGSDLVMLQGSSLTLTVWVWCNTPGTYSVYLTSSGRDYSYVANFTITTPNVYVPVTVPNIPPMPAAGTWNFGQGQTGMYIGVAFGVGAQWQTPTQNAWHPAFAAGTSANTNLLTVINNQIKITGIKLEASTVPSYLSVPSFEADFEECIRYYFTTFNYQSTSAGVAMELDTPTNGVWSGSMLFPRRMAKAPTVTPYGYVSHAVGQITDISAANTDLPVASLAATPKGICDSKNAVISTTGTIAAIGMNGIIALNSIEVTGMTSTATLSAGMGVTGAGIAPGTVLDFVATGTSIMLSKAANGPGTVTLTFGTLSITGIPSTTGMKVGQSISGPGIPARATIASIVSGSAITISAPTTAPGTNVALTVSQITKGDVLWALINADARLT